MAESVNLIDLYEYLYAATSSFVHFSPRNLGRMGWGDIRTQEFEFSTDNFASYYDTFNKFYSLYLLITFSTTFASILDCREDIEVPINILIDAVNTFPRWPEIITHEEMNWTKTSPFLRLVSPYDYVGNPESGMAPKLIWNWE